MGPATDRATQPTLDQDHQEAKESSSWHTMSFGPLTIDFDHRVLLPRPWTFAQSVWAAELADTAPVGPMLEVCAGAGQIGLAAARCCTDRGAPRRLVLVDGNALACTFARTNAERSGIGTGWEIRNTTMDEALAANERFAVIMADPPWVPSVGTIRYPNDPLWAIDGGADGLDVARSCLMIISRHLRPGGSAVLQLGTRAQVARLLGERDTGLEVTEIRCPAGENGVLARLVRDDQSAPGR